MVGYVLPSNNLHRKPVWLDILLAEKFFTACVEHIACRKNEKNIFCVECSVGVCQHCMLDHNSHRHLQIRRYVYHDVIRLHDLQKLFDCSRVQPYTINSARVVFLNERPQTKSPKGLSNSCETCDRSLQEAYRYCSVACKVNSASFKNGALLEVRNSPDWISSLDSCPREEGSKVHDSGSENEQETASSPTSSGSASNDAQFEWQNAVSRAQTIDMPLIYCSLAKRPRTAPGASSPRSVIPTLNRRKGKPQRSPIC